MARSAPDPSKGTHSSSSSNTSTSHTLSADPVVTKMSSTITSTTLQNGVHAPATILKMLVSQDDRAKFMPPPTEFADAIVATAKDTLDRYAAQISEEQAQRLKESRKKRKRGEGDVVGDVLRIKKIHTEGFEPEQVWEQTKRVIDAIQSEVTRELEMLEEAGESELDQDQSSGDVEMLKFDEEGFEVGSDDESDAEDDGEEEEDMEGEDEIEDEDADDVDAMLKEIENEEGEDDFEGFDDEEDDEDDAEEEPKDVFVEDPHGLNDGFFSIDEFNRQTEFLEQEDGREAPDEAEIDFDADPMAMPMEDTTPKSTMDIDDVPDSDDDEEDGPTFGNMDLDAPEGASGDEDDDQEMDDGVGDLGDNTNDIHYADFFEPPPRKVTKSELQSNYLARQERKKAAASAEDDEDDEAQMQRAMADVRRDLFDDESEAEDSEDALSDVDPSDPKSRKSAHERRQAKLAEEIRKLEAASVQKREWTLAGEAKAVDRPMNSLLEEDLDFERTGKPVPVITAAVSESIEDLIKRRILAQEFDEVIRRRPDAENAAVRRGGAFELDDTKNEKSLAELYEEEHVKNTNPDTYMSKADEKLKAEEAEIEGLWKDVSAKLDALSSWHYKPKPAAPSLTVVADVATVTMEDAQPATASGLAGAESMLAPQEIYKAGKDKDAVEKGEVVRKDAAPVAKQEMTREEKLRRRRREKERMRKRGGLEAGKRPEGKKAKEKRETVGELKRGGVRVIGKTGEILDAQGQKVKAQKALNGAGSFKL